MPDQFSKLAAGASSHSQSSHQIKCCHWIREKNKEQSVSVLIKYLSKVFFFSKETDNFKYFDLNYMTY